MKDDTHHIVGEFGFTFTQPERYTILKSMKQYPLGVANPLVVLLAGQTAAILAFVIAVWLLK